MTSYDAGRPRGLYDSAQTLSMTMAQIKSRQKALLEKRAISGLFGIRELDEYVVPLWPGDLAYVSALPSSGKSFLVRMFQKRVVDLLLENDDGRRVGVTITTEESIEKIGAHWLASMSGVSSTDMLSGNLLEEEKVTVNAAVAEVGSWPLWIIGHSSSTRDESGRLDKRSALRLTTQEIDACLNYIANKKKKDVVFVTLDYLHRIRNDGSSDREGHMRSCVDWTRDVANWLGAPHVVAAQAKAKVAQQPFHLPGIADVEWTMNAGQSADTFLGLWMPKSTKGVGGMLDSFAGFPPMPIEEDMMFVLVAKQKDGRSGTTFLLRVKPHLMEWELLDASKFTEHEVIDLNPDRDGVGPNNWPSQAPISF